MPAIRDGRAEFGVSLQQWLEGACPDNRRGLMPRMARALGVRIPPLSVVADVAPAEARVDYGRWCADCPNCGGAEMVWLEGPYQMWCGQCGNADLGGQHRPVTMPEDAAGIGEVLGARARPAEQCWRSGQEL